jgi:hypothetical protein
MLNRTEEEKNTAELSDDYWRAEKYQAQDLIKTLSVLVVTGELPREIIDIYESSIT